MNLTGKLNLQCVGGDAIPVVKVDVSMCGNDAEDEVLPRQVLMTDEKAPMVYLLRLRYFGQLLSWI